MPSDYGVPNPYPLLDPKNDPNSPEQRELLTDPKAPHETSGVLRMYRAGWPASEISKTTGIICGPPLMSALKRGMDQETEANDMGLDIHDDRVASVETRFVRARDIAKGDELVAHGAAVVGIKRSYSEYVFVLEGGVEAKHTALDEVLITRSTT